MEGLTRGQLIAFIDYHGEEIVWEFGCYGLEGRLPPSLVDAEGAALVTLYRLGTQGQDSEAYWLRKDLIVRALSEVEEAVYRLTGKLP